MPIQACTTASGSTGFRWGSGKCYASRKKAERQAAAIYASGYVGKGVRLVGLAKGDVPGHEFHGNQWTPDYAGNLALHLQEKTGSIFGHWEGKLSASEQRSLFGRFIGKGTIVIDGKEETISNRVSVGFGQDYDHRNVTRWSELRTVKKNLDSAAHSAATSPFNLRPAPTPAQASAGNYKMGHTRFAGLSISIENPAGSYRKPEWPPMQAHYGYVKGTEGADGDHVDCFVRPSTPMDWDGEAYVIDQLDANGEFDEHKILLGWDDQASAEKAYLGHYPKGWKLGEVTAMSLDELKAWLEGDTTEDVAKDWTASTSPTSGITAYGSTKKRKTKLKQLRSKT